MKTVNLKAQRQGEILSELEKIGVTAVITTDGWTQLVLDGERLYCYKCLLDTYTMEEAKSIHGILDVISHLMDAEIHYRAGLYRKTHPGFLGLFAQYKRVW